SGVSSALSARSRIKGIARVPRAPLARPPGKTPPPTPARGDPPIGKDGRTNKGRSCERPFRSGKSVRRERASGGLFLDAIAEEALGIDRVEAQPVLQFLAQLADVAFDHVLVDVLVEEPVDGVEDLRLADAPAAAAQQKFEDPPLPPRERKRLAVRLGLAPIEIDAEFPDRHMPLLTEHAPVDGADPRDNLAHMHGLPQDVVRPGGEQTQRVVERMTLIEAQNRRVRPLADESRQLFALAAVADHERLYRIHVRIADLADPFAKFGRLDPG